MGVGAGDNGTLNGPTRRSRDPWSGVMLAIIAAAAAGVIAGLVLAPDPVPPSAGVDSRAKTIALTKAPFADPRLLKLVITVAPKVALVVRDAGIVTSIDCAPGNTWASGSTPLTINDSPRLLLSTSRPLWRDLVGGEEGPDVVAVQSALLKLGYDSPTTGNFDPDTRAAWARMLRDRDIASTYGELDLGDLVALPASTVTVASCTVGPGAEVAQGTAIAVLTSGLTSLKPTRALTGLVPGARSLTIGATTVAANVHGDVTNPGSLAALEAEPVVQIASAASPAADADGTLALTTPLTVYPVPPAALHEVSGTAACIVSGATGYPVTIIASSLGTTSITFAAGTTPPASAALERNSGVSCG